jgi:cytochrome c biogenesis protein CcdA
MLTLKKMILCIALNLVLATFSVFAAPRLIVPPEGVAFGEIPAGEAAEKAIELRNDSSSPVLISQVKGCCGADAALSTMRLEPSSGATLTVSLKPTIPGEFSKHVRILCDDPECPVVVVPVTGAAVEMPSTNISSQWTFLTVLLAGLADGFNPCAFSIIIVLAGILAVGGRKRRARLLGGWSFCTASFLTYMAMGLGLMRVLRTLECMRLFYDIVMTTLSITLFILGFLSVRDAYRYRKEKVPSAIALQLPDKVKRLIRVVAETSWKGQAVVITGFGCGFLVTLLDSLCTGQIYIPVLALISRDVEAWRSFMFLVVYNLAFIAPLIVIFILAAKGADSERMSRWSKRNVFPSKIAMGFVFVILGALILPKFGGFLVEALAEF